MTYSTVAIAHHANWIWDQLNTNSDRPVNNGTADRVNQANRDLCLSVAASIEKAETCADEYRLHEAAGWIVDAARQVFGFYSETYSQFVRFYS